MRFMIGHENDLLNYPLILEINIDVLTRYRSRFFECLHNGLSNCIEINVKFKSVIRY